MLMFYVTLHARVLSICSISVILYLNQVAGDFKDFAAFKRAAFSNTEKMLFRYTLHSDNIMFFSVLNLKIVWNSRIANTETASFGSLYMLCLQTFSLRS